MSTKIQGERSVARIEDLKGIVSGRGGFANPTLYRIELPALPGAGVSTRDFSLLCKSVSIPGRQIATLPREIGVQKQFVAMNHEVPPVQLVFRILNDYAIKNYFEYWQNLMINQESFEVGYSNEYSKTVKIQQLKKSVAFNLFDVDLGILNLDIDLVRSYPPVYEVELLKAIPTSVTGYQLGDDLTDQVSEITVELAYKNWRNRQVSKGVDNTYIPSGADAVEPTIEIGPQRVSKIENIQTTKLGPPRFPNPNTLGRRTGPQ